MLVELMTERYPGMRLWLTQRFSAIVMMIFIATVLTRLVINQPTDFQQWRQFLSPWWFKIMALSTFVCLIVHAWLGVRDVMRDYIWNMKVRALMQLLMEILLVIYLIWFSSILWNL